MDSEPVIPQAQPLGGDLASGVVDVIGNNEFVAGFFTLSGFLAVLNTLWSIYVFLAYIFSIVLLYLYVYASIRKNQYDALREQVLRDAEQLYDEQFRGAPRNSRLQDVLTHSASSNPNDWKLAIIEADIILDDILKQRGYAGASLGERLKSISTQQLASLDDAWSAHRVRNRIAHDGSDFVLTQRLADETINQYRRVFAEFGIT